MGTTEVLQKVRPLVEAFEATLIEQIELCFLQCIRGNRKSCNGFRGDHLLHQRLKQVVTTKKIPSFSTDAPPQLRKRCSAVHA